MVGHRAGTRAAAASDTASPDGDRPTALADLASAASGGRGGHEPPRYAYIDALRGLAVLGVVVVHVGNLPLFAGLPASVLLLCRQCAHGVQLFYVASALTLFLSLSAGRHDEPHWVARFYARRLFRIAPMFYVGMLLYLAFYGLGPRPYAPAGISRANIVATALFVNGWHPYWINSIVPGGWSVAVEMAFYVLVPVLYCRVRSLRMSVGVFGVSLGAACVLNFAAGRLVGPWVGARSAALFTFLWLPNQFPVFALGIVLFHLLQVRDREARRDGPAVGSRGLATALLVVCAFCAASASRLLPQHVAYAGAFVALGLALSLDPVPWIVSRPLRYLGRISYSVYILSVAVVDLAGAAVGWGIARAHLASPVGWAGVCLVPVVVAAALLALVAAGTLTYRFVEAPGLEVGRRICRRAGQSRGRGTVAA